MRDRDCIDFLQANLPRLGLRWAGYRKVRGTVCKRLGRRLRALGLGDLDAYAAYLQATPAEWANFETLCRIPISRFYRDRLVFETLRHRVLPELARDAVESGRADVRFWSAGCASGEEPYSLSILWREAIEPEFASISLDLLATDAEPAMLARASRACYSRGSLKDLPSPWRERAFVEDNANYCLRDVYKRGVRFALQDIRMVMPSASFDLILCRNQGFTYFDDAGRQELLAKLSDRLRRGGYLVIGGHERLPPGAAGLHLLDPNLPIFFKSAIDPTACAQ